MSNAWMKDLKVGDKVVVSSRNGRSITTIAKITPTGIIKTEKGTNSIQMVFKEVEILGVHILYNN